MDLPAALDALYAKFKAPVPRRIDGCPCCIERKEVKQYHTTPLRELSEDDLGSYTMSVFYTVGSVQDFRYFLPRILELATLNPDLFPDIETGLVKLRLAGWLDWPTDERNAIISVIDAWFDQLAASQQPAHPYDGPISDIGSLLCAIALTGLDLDRYLARLLDYPVSLRFLCDWNRESIVLKGHLNNPYWESERGPEARVIAFLNSSPVLAIVSEVP